MVDQDTNNQLVSMPTLEEVKKVVFELFAYSAGGPDGMIGIFYHVCWDIVSADVYILVKASFDSQTLPKSVTHTNLVLLPKKNNIETFADMRPISLSNFINKVISRVVQDKLEGILPSLISPNQSGFVKGRCIIENVLLTQEVVTDSRLRGKPANVILKLDMAKAYDRVSWSYLIRVLRKMGFAEIFIDMVWRMIANNWYSILLNGQAYGFFHSTRGVKQGDPLSPALFILSADVLSRALNSLFENNEFRNDIIIFSSADARSLELIMEVETITGFKRGTFLFTYLGCPVTHSRKRKVDYNDLIKKVKNRLQTWKGRLLSFGGKAVLINNVLMSMPIHLLSAIKPPKCIINDMHKIFSRFFWNNSEEGRRRRWSSWLNLCKPKEERGVGFRSLFDVSKALCAKLWWKLRTTNTLWVNYMWIKYCKRHSPQTVQWEGGSQVWKAMIEARYNIEQEIWWEPRSGTANVWFDNWTKLGAPYHIIPDNFEIDEGVQDVKELMLQDGWNIGKLQQLFPMDIVDHILEELHFHEPKEEWDRPRWMMTASGKFTVGTAWELLRSKAVKSDVFKNMQYETVDHLFVTVNGSTKAWTYVKTVVGITTQFQQVRQILQVWWNADCPSKFITIFKAIPMVTMWQIWKWRNTILHGGRMSINKVIYEINMIIYQMCRMRFPWQTNLPRCIPQILQVFEVYRSRIVSKIVKWDFPMPGWYKCNSDGASRGNRGPSPVAFCIRNAVGDLQYAAARRIPDGSNLIAEAKALHEGLKYCVTHSLLPVMMETDSITMKMILTGQWETPWSISMIINDISRLRSDKEVRVEHVLREGNGLADFLTNYSFDFARHLRTIISLEINSKQLESSSSNKVASQPAMNSTWTCMKLSLAGVQEWYYLEAHSLVRLLKIGSFRKHETMANKGQHQGKEIAATSEVTWMNSTPSWKPEYVLCQKAQGGIGFAGRVKVGKHKDWNRKNSYLDRIVVYNELSTNLRRNCCARGLYSDQLGSDENSDESRNLSGDSKSWFEVCGVYVHVVLRNHGANNGFSKCEGKVNRIRISSRFRMGYGLWPCFEGLRWFGKVVVGPIDRIQSCGFINQRIRAKAICLFEDQLWGKFEYVDMIIGA
ncbi:uncharacterized protein LOC132630997 [Lycium barbarum]|uniref:uncharacterized protein LOC132630997 n=1 Tax=Lycium barbarum TaxID=112863 RepID=UPI00293EB688|nr:uncharacterized protein LOC132630997 [Lycium barbarum]